MILFLKNTKKQRSVDGPKQILNSNDDDNMHEQPLTTLVKKREKNAHNSTTHYLKYMQVKLIGN